MKRKFVSSAANTWKSRMFDTDFVISLFQIFWPGQISLSQQRQQHFLKLDFEA